MDKPRNEFGSPEYRQGGTPPGLRNLNWRPLKTWHLAYSRMKEANCGSPTMPAGAVRELPPGVRLCRYCKAVSHG